MNRRKISHQIKRFRVDEGVTTVLIYVMDLLREGKSCVIKNDPKKILSWLSLTDG